MTFKSIRKYNRSGFTLVELMVVLVIMGIITAMVVPSLTGYIDKYKYEELRRQASYGEDALMNLAARQYGEIGSREGTIAQSQIMNFGDTYNDPTLRVQSENYIQIDNWVNNTFWSGHNLVQFTVANSRPKQGDPPYPDSPHYSEGFTLFERLTSSEILTGQTLHDPTTGTNGYGYAYIKILCENPGALIQNGANWSINNVTPDFYPSEVTATQIWIVKDNKFYYIEHNWVASSAIQKGWRISVNSQAANTINQYSSQFQNSWTVVYTKLG
jgi:prepilin-type N-terminal cleavage/methylation domain-containing protein